MKALEQASQWHRQFREPQPRVLAVILAAGATGVVVILFGLAYMQLPTLIFVGAALSGLWVGIASLFSP